MEKLKRWFACMYMNLNSESHGKVGTSQWDSGLCKNLPLFQPRFRFTSLISSEKQGNRIDMDFPSVHNNNIIGVRCISPSSPRIYLIYTNTERRVNHQYKQTKSQECTFQAGSVFTQKMKQWC